MALMTSNLACPSGELMILELERMMERMMHTPVMMERMMELMMHTPVMMEQMMERMMHTPVMMEQMMLKSLFLLMRMMNLLLSAIECQYWSLQLLHWSYSYNLFVIEMVILYSHFHVCFAVSCFESLVPFFELKLYFTLI